MADRREAARTASRERDRPPESHLRIAILADDLIWSSRLADAATAAGGEPVRVRRETDLVAAIGAGVSLAIVDLTARAYDGVEAVGAATRAGARVLAVGQHDDVELRKRAIEAGAGKVFAYRKLFEDGPATIGQWLERTAAEGGGSGR